MYLLQHSPNASHGCPSSRPVPVLPSTLSRPTLHPSVAVDTTTLRTKTVREVVRRYKDSNELSPLFCVETSCTLVEVAWQAYYDPHRVNLSDFVAPGRQDLSYLGLELVVGDVVPVVCSTMT